MFHNELDRKIRLKMKFYCYEKMLKDANVLRFLMNKLYIYISCK